MPSKHLLIVDDNPAIGEFVRNVAEGIGYSVDTQTDAAGFKAAYEAVVPDVIILDLSMPDTDGFELITYLSERRSPARVFIMSGFGASYQRMAAEMGDVRGLTMGGTIPKPVRAAELRTILTQPPDGSTEEGGT